jgi:hypothetical protein
LPTMLTTSADPETPVPNTRARVFFFGVVRWNSSCHVRVPRGAQARRRAGGYRKTPEQ